MPSLTYPPKPRPGDRVAILSPAAPLAAMFPHVYAQGLERLRALDLVPVEYPTTRAATATAAERARDVMAAFTDPEIAAVMAVIGGDDQITVVPHLKPVPPKPFFGYSDNTNLLHWLWSQGIVGYHGGSVMVHLGRGGAPHPLTMESLWAALFTSGDYELTCPEVFSDESYPWDDPANVDREPPTRPAAPWSWHGDVERVVEGRTWGGNLEVVTWMLASGRVGEVEADVLFVETSEEMPPDLEVYRMLRNMGERGLLGTFGAVLVGRAKAWEHETAEVDVPTRQAYADAQRAAVLQAVQEYNPGAVMVLDVDFGHTDPQLVIPYGGTARVDGPARRITVRY